LFGTTSQDGAFGTGTVFEIVSDAFVVAPTIAGTARGQTTASETPVRPFAHVTVGDANAGATDTLTINIGGGGGTLADGHGLQQPDDRRRRSLQAERNCRGGHQRTRRAHLHPEGRSA
jgi:hypothetical protein